MSNTSFAYRITNFPVNQCHKHHKHDRQDCYFSDFLESLLRISRAFRPFFLCRFCVGKKKALNNPQSTSQSLSIWTILECFFFNLLVLSSPQHHKKPHLKKRKNSELTVTKQTRNKYTVGRRCSCPFRERLMPLSRHL